MNGVCGSVNVFLIRTLLCLTPLLSFLISKLHLCRRRTLFGVLRLSPHAKSNYSPPEFSPLTSQSEPPPNMLSPLDISLIASTQTHNNTTSQFAPLSPSMVSHHTRTTASEIPSLAPNTSLFPSLLYANCQNRRFRICLG